MRYEKSERGATTIQFVVASGLGLALLVLAANVMVDMYARGAVRDALDEGVRAGSVAADPTRACEAEIAKTIEALLNGPLGEGVDTECRAEGDGWVHATARVRLESWLPGLPDWNFTLRAVARQRG